MSSITRVVPAQHLLGDEPDDPEEVFVLVVSNMAKQLFESATRSDIRPDGEYRITLELERVEE